MLPADADTAVLRFTLRVLPGVGTPSACNDADYQKALEATLRSYMETHGFTELARRYAHNLANGRFLWRNRLSADAVEVQVRRINTDEENKAWTFDALDFSLKDFQAPAQAEQALTELAQTIEAGLAGNGPVFLEVTAYARVGHGQEVFPSQELVLDQHRRRALRLRYQPWHCLPPTPGKGRFLPPP